MKFSPFKIALTAVGIGSVAIAAGSIYRHHDIATKRKAYEETINVAKTRMWIVRDFPHLAPAVLLPTFRAGARFFRASTFKNHDESLFAYRVRGLDLILNDLVESNLLGKDQASALYVESVCLLAEKCNA